jgi:hypothetical protein
MRQQKKKGGFFSFNYSTPTLVDRWGNKIVDQEKLPVGNVSSFDRNKFITIESNKNKNTLLDDSNAYYNQAPYKNILAEIANKDIKKYQELTCKDERNKVMVLESLLKGAKETGNTNEIKKYEIKLSGTKNNRDRCFNIKKEFLNGKSVSGWTNTPSGSRSNTPLRIRSDTPSGSGSNTPLNSRPTTPIRSRSNSYSSNNSLYSPYSNTRGGKRKSRSKKNKKNKTKKIRKTKN